MCLRFDVGGDVLAAQPQGLVIVGFTGRDSAAVERHVAELEAAGVPRPASVPAFYPAPAALLTQAGSLQVAHERTSGEAEIVLFEAGGRRWVTLGSDHTDRAAETLEVALSKLVCPKPLATAAWPLDDVAPRWDELRLRSWIWEDGERRVYQDGRAAELLAPAALSARMPRRSGVGELAVFTGTVPAIGGIRSSRRFEAQLLDETSGRAIELAYEIAVLALLETR